MKLSSKLGPCMRAPRYGSTQVVPRRKGDQRSARLYDKRDAGQSGRAHRASPTPICENYHDWESDGLPRSRPPSVCGPIEGLRTSAMPAVICFRTLDRRRPSSLPTPNFPICASLHIVFLARRPASGYSAGKMYDHCRRVAGPIRLGDICFPASRPPVSLRESRPDDLRSHE